MLFRNNKGKEKERKNVCGIEDFFPLESWFHSLLCMLLKCLGRRKGERKKIQVYVILFSTGHDTVKL